jgi:hypothetical protein
MATSPDQFSGSVSNKLSPAVLNNKQPPSEMSRRCDYTLTSNYVMMVGSGPTPFVSFTTGNTTGNTGGILVPFNTLTIPTTPPTAFPITYHKSGSFFTLDRGYEYKLSASAIISSVDLESDIEFSIGWIELPTYKFIGKSSTKLPLSGTIPNINTSLSVASYPRYVALGIQPSKGNSFTGSLAGSFTGSLTIKNICCTINFK